MLAYYHDHGGWVRPTRAWALPKQGVVRTKDESKGGPNMGMGHSKGTSRVKCGVHWHLPKHGVVRMKDESKGGPNMGMGHSKGTSCVKCDVLASCVRKYIIINLLKKFLKKNLGREQEKKKRKDPSPNKRSHPKVQNA
jgi:hypothetical protein